MYDYLQLLLKENVKQILYNGDQVTLVTDKSRLTLIATFSEHSHKPIIKVIKEKA